MNRYKTLFGLAADLNLGHEALREMAASYTGKPSLRTLKPHHIRASEIYLMKEKDKRLDRKVRDWQFHFKENVHLSYKTKQRFLRLAVAVWPNFDTFKVWMRNDLKVSHVNWLTESKAQQLIRALMAMQRRGYRVRAKSQKPTAKS